MTDETNDAGAEGATGRDPKEPVHTFPLAVGPNPTGHDDMAAIAHARDEEGNPTMPDGVARRRQARAKTTKKSKKER